MGKSKCAGTEKYPTSFLSVETFFTPAREQFPAEENEDYFFILIDNNFYSILIFLLIHNLNIGSLMKMRLSSVSINSFDNSDFLTCCTLAEETS